MLLTPVLAAFLGAAQAVPASPPPDAFDRQATAFYRRGEWDRLLALADARLADSAPNDPKRADYLLTRGEAYSELHDPRAAREALDAALPLAEALHDPLLLARIHRHRGLLIIRYDRDLASAEREYGVALAYARRAHAPGEIVNVLIVTANPYRNPATLDLPRALRLYGEALAIVRREGLAGSLPILLKNIGDAYRLQGDVENAERVLLEAMQLADRGGTEQRWSTRHALGQLARDRHPADAEQYFLAALDILDAKQSSVLLEDLRAGTLAGALLFADPYDEYIDLLMEQGRPDDAFLVAERQRARVFLDTLSGARDTIARRVPAGFVDEERRLLDQIRSAQADLRVGGIPDSRRSTLMADIGRSEAALDDLRVRLAVEHPALAQARYPTLATVPALRSRVIAADEALVSVYLGARRSVAWVITRAGLTAIALPPRRIVEPLVSSALTALRDPVAADGSAVVALSSALKTDEIARAAARPRMIIVPYGSLYDLPFDVLVDAGGRPLVERFATSYVASASVLAFLRSAPARVSGGPALVTVANPLVSGVQAAARRPADLAHLDLLMPLPSAAREAHRIAQIFGGGATVLEGARATRAELERSGVAHARIVHFATHGLIDEERPERSGLVLTADPPRDDGLLQMRQIYGLHLDADLVTLSACDTALGQHVTGEGMIGLTRAFFVAGARAVIASLWEVEDTQTARLMDDFYGGLRSGRPIDIALQQAKVASIRRGGREARAFYWAAFVVNGQARTTLADSHAWFAARAAAWTVAAALVTILATLLIARRSLRPRPDAATATV
jgi:tetratricopeptide (TPR) repeat protein